MKLAILVFGLFAVGTAADAASFEGSGEVSDADVRRFLDSEFAATASAKLQSIEDGLRNTFTSLPKNVHGNLEPQAVRYVLHRYFVQRHGWFIRGLEGTSQSWSDDKPLDAKEWVPSYLQDLMKTRTGQMGTNLHELAIMAAALEDLVDTEARKRMKVAFDIHGLPFEGELNEDQVTEVVDTYYVLFLNAGHFNVTSREDAIAKRKLWSKKYVGFEESDQWMRDLLKPRFGTEGYDFDKTARMVEDIGENYYKFNDLECSDLKQTMMSMEGSKAGRVRLSQFYKKSLFSHWRFTEKAEYLRILGALDESDPSSPQVIVANYVMSRPNCLESSNLYAICCRNECEDLTGHLEAKIGQSMADPKEIAELVAALPSPTVAAPRELSEGLLQKLELVASSNGGKVPLHGRLFAQWMHHAYPRECPYPHEVGTTSPQTPDEWMAAAGQDSQATESEMQEAVDADTCSVESGPGCGGSELPWNENEELLISVSASGSTSNHGAAAVAAASILSQRYQAAAEAAAASEDASRGSFESVDDAAATPSASGSASLWWVRDLCIAACLFGLLAADRLCLKNGQIKLKDEDVELKGKDKQGGLGWRAVLTFTALAFVAHAFNLLDTLTFGLTVVGGTAVAVMQYFAEKDGKKRRQKTMGDCDSFESKCCV